VNINLHIERLVLDGVNIAPGQGDLLQTNLTAELTRLINNGGLAENLVEGLASSRLPTSDIQLTSNKPVELGQKIAQSVYGGIGSE
jgi:hypothetical protein